MNKVLLIVGLAITIFISSCSKSGGTSGGTTSPPVDPCAGLAFKFAVDVQPIINSTCSNSSSCHGTGSVNSGGELTDYNKIFIKRSIIKGQINAGLMPKAGSITTAEKNKIICWIDSGAPNN